MKSLCMAVAIGAVLSTALLPCPALGRDRRPDMLFSGDTSLTGDVTVPDSATCIINPGARIKFASYSRFAVFGLLIAEGTPLAPIIFSGDPSSGISYQRTSWRGLEIIGAKAQARFTHCRIEGAYRNLIWESSPAFDSCMFSLNHYAIYCAKQAAPAIRNCSFFLMNSIIAFNSYCME